MEFILPLRGARTNKFVHATLKSQSFRITCRAARWTNKFGCCYFFDLFV